MKDISWNKLNYAKLTKEQRDSLIQTPLGLFHVNDITNQFNLWLGHTNFTLTVGFLKGIRSITGVEAFNNITPLRFILAIGTMFDENQVKMEIENLVKEDELTEVKKTLEQYKDWAIYQFPNGNVEITHCDKTNFSKKIHEFSELKSDIGGRLIRPFGV